eukprot:CAMPEP_0116925292 /NCGR_PEP_ID=MMETSP0467-20121206/24033_1 /TAXON_ID=283647 /ORGANISM="Mesodinium pulex, Strain SPMC105" /LENGTH=108 /DNA_ID=CAMNT_0004604311 /DNA_START=429 /DNA_END=755 /DNA_ORIENTATION=-
MVQMEELLVKYNLVSKKYEELGEKHEGLLVKFSDLADENSRLKRDLVDHTNDNLLKKVEDQEQRIENYKMNIGHKESAIIKLEDELVDIKSYCALLKESLDSMEQKLA